MFRCELSWQREKKSSSTPCPFHWIERDRRQLQPVTQVVETPSPPSPSQCYIVLWALVFINLVETFFQHCLVGEGGRHNCTDSVSASDTDCSLWRRYYLGLSRAEWIAWQALRTSALEATRRKLPAFAPIKCKGQRHFRFSEPWNLSQFKPQFTAWSSYENDGKNVTANRISCR